MVAIQIYQPVAMHLGYDKPGGFRLEVPVDGVTPLKDVLTSCADCKYDLTELIDGEYGATCMVVVNGQVIRQGIRAEVADGDEVAVFRMISGG